MDRQFIAQELGFYGGVCPNSMDAVSDRDFVVETLFFCSLHLVHLSRWAEDLIIYSSGAFKYVQCSDAYATGEHLNSELHLICHLLSFLACTSGMLLCTEYTLQGCFPDLAAASYVIPNAHSDLCYLVQQSRGLMTL